MNPNRIYRGGPISRLHYGAVSPATGCTDHRTHRRLMADWYGLTPLTGWHWWTGAACPHRAVSRRCPGWPTCQPLPLWDHPRAWRDSDGIKTVTLEPWGNPFRTIEAYFDLTEALEPLNAAVAYEGRSPYGASYVLFIKPAAHPLQGLPDPEPEPEPAPAVGRR